jgi:hydrogenase/urease accessory protein HupE
MSLIRHLWLIVLLFGFFGLARAHDPGLSTAQGIIRQTTLELTNGFAPADIEHLLPAAQRDGVSWTTSEFGAVREQLLALAPRLWDVRSDDVAISPRDCRVSLLPGDNVSFDLLYSLPDGASTITLRAIRITDLRAGHRMFLDVTNAAGWTLESKLLNADDASLEVSLVAQIGTTRPHSSPPSFRGFLKLGITHIWTGYDHLLFLLALLVVCRTFRSIVVIISCFTLAHSLTLALATLDLVNFPPRSVEAMIAASIVFVGVENILRRGEEPRGRWALTFGFGLIHGFGFASVLRDLGVGSGGQGIAMPLLSFNLGVELGQIVVAGLVLPVVWLLRKNEGFMKRGVPIVSGIVALAGLYWFLERTLFT